MRLPIILIGLSLLLLNGCILTEIDPPNKNYLEIYKNLSSEEVTIVMKNTNTSGIVKTFSISQGREEGGLYSENYFNGGDSPIQEYLRNLEIGNIERIELYVDNILVKEWTGPPNHYGSDTNSPFNYDSWVFEPIEPYGNNIVGKIIFTITDEDIEN